MAITALKWQRANEGDDRLRSDLLISRLTSMDFEDSCNAASQEKQSLLMRIGLGHGFCGIGIL
eukprot:6091845-Amphidinium_carterae.1